MFSFMYGSVILLLNGSFHTITLGPTPSASRLVCESAACATGTGTVYS